MNTFADEQSCRVCTLVLLAALFLVGGRNELRAAERGELAAGPVFTVAPDCARGGRRIQREPAAAFGKAAGEAAGVYLVAWSDGTRQIEKPTADIYCARVEAGTGKVLDPNGVRICAAAGLQECPAVAFDGTNFLVVWQDLRNGTDYDVYAARVSPVGKVLDPDGFAVAAGKGNQARPAVAFAGGNFIVCWMDARQYPVYGLYAARVSPEGKVLDDAGKALDAEDSAKIAKATPPGEQWLGDRNYWWQGLSSRFQPRIASDGTTCLVTYLRDQHANETTPWAMRVSGADLSVASPPVKLSGSPKDRIVPCRSADGWSVAMDHWVSGWSPTPRLAALSLDAMGQPRQAIPGPPDAPKRKPELPAAGMLDLQKALAGSDREGTAYQQGKGHFTFWQSAIAWDAKQVVVASDYGWRTKAAGGKPTEMHYAVVASRLAADGSRFTDDPPVVLAAGKSADDTCPRRPTLAAGPAGEVLAVYEWDAGVDRLTIQGRLLRP